MKTRCPCSRSPRRCFANDPSDWEAIYRQGIALEQLGKPGEAAARFQKIAELTAGDDQKSALAREQAKNPRILAAAGFRYTIAARTAMPLGDRIAGVTSSVVSAS